MTRPRVLLRGEDSGGRLALVEMSVKAGFGGPPLHSHETWHEGFYVLEGELSIQCGDRTIRARPGMFVHAGRNVPHTFANLSGREARMLVVLAPAGYERYLAGEEDRKSGVARVAAWLESAGPGNDREIESKGE